MTYRNGEYESHGYDLWKTPQSVKDDLIKEFGELFDPCPENWDGETDGLEIEWPIERACFVNPPYSKMVHWVKKCFEQYQRGCTVILLIPPRSCTRYFHQYIYGYSELRFFKGRLKFIDGRDPESKPKPAPFPSMLAIFKHSQEPLEVALSLMSESQIKEYMELIE